MVSAGSCGWGQCGAEGREEGFGQLPKDGLHVPG